MSQDHAGDAVETELNRDIGIVGAVALGVGTMIAAGIFVLSGLAVSNVGAMAVVAFVIAAIVASFTAFAYAEFASIYPESGGGYAYVSNTFDSDLTYIVGWSMILGYPASAAFYLASFSDWFFRFIYPVFGIPEWVPYWVSGLVILGLLVGLNLKGTEESGQFQIAVTALKVGLIILFLYGGLRALDAGAVEQSVMANLTAFRDIGLTSALVFITFFGFEAIATNAEEIEKPGTTIPRAIFFSMGFVTVVYTLVVLVVVTAVNDPNFLEFLRQEAALSGLAPEQFVAENGEIAMGRAAQYYLGPVGFYVIIAGALFSMLSAANATVLAGSRVKLAMSRRDHLPARFERLHDSFNTPHNAVLLTGGLIAVIIFLFTIAFGGGPESEATLHAGAFELHLGIEAIAHFADFMLLTGLVVVNLAVIQSRRKYPDIDRRFEVPAVPAVPIVAVLANLVLLVNVEPSSFFLGLVAEAIGVVLWFALIGQPSEERIEAETPTLVTERHAKDRDYRILVPIADPDHVPQLMKTAVDVARDRDGEIVVVSVVQLPDQTPLSEGDQYADQNREIVNRAMDLAEDVPVSGTVRIGHHVDDAILNTVRQWSCDAVLMGWSGSESRRRDIVLGSTVDSVAKDAPCDLMVERIGEEAGGSIESILVPSAGGPHATYAAEVARAIARSTGANIEFLHCVSHGGDVEGAESMLREVAAETETAEADIAVVESDDVAGTILEQSRGHDLTVIGATREGLLEELVFGAVPETVARNAEGTVLMTKRYLGVTSHLRQLIRR